MANTGKIINYSLRPSKNVERKMICEYIRELKKEYEINKYRYIGFGSFYFSDFILLHKEFNINKMISIEKDERNSERFNFNKPYSCIDIYFGESSDVLNSDIEWDSRTKDIIWLDYDKVLDESKILDFETCIKNSISGSLVMLSFNATLNDKREGGRREDLIKNCTEERVSTDILEKELDPIESHKTFRKIINNALEKSLVDKNSKYVEECDKYSAKQIIFFKYRDAAPMLTLGYILIKNSELDKYNRCKFNEIEFFSENEDPYKIDVPNFTYKELQLINSKLPNVTIDNIQKEMPFISMKDLEKYTKIYRYFPNFMETN